MKPVWIIDDDRSIRWVFEKALSREGIAFESYASGEAALSALEKTSPQVIVSDIRMPGSSGLELLKQMKERYPKVPVIIMTAYSDLESAVSAFQGGAFEYLPKPFDIDHAVALLRQAPFAAEERVIDLSGDGPDMRSLRPAAAARDAAVAAQVTINALAIADGCLFIRTRNHIYCVGE